MRARLSPPNKQKRSLFVTPFFTKSKILEKEGKTRFLRKAWFLLRKNKKCGIYGGFRQMLMKRKNGRMKSGKRMSKRAQGQSPCERLTWAQSFFKTTTISGYCLNEVSLAAWVEFTSDKTAVSATSLFAYYLVGGTKRVSQSATPIDFHSLPPIRFFGNEKKRLWAECAEWGAHPLGDTFIASNQDSRAHESAKK